MSFDSNIKQSPIGSASDWVLSYNILMHDHHNTNLVLGITEMQLMWILMGLMAIHHIWMWWKMRNKRNCKK